MYQCPSAQQVLQKIAGRSAVGREDVGRGVGMVGGGGGRGGVE